MAAATSSLQGRIIIIITTGQPLSRGWGEGLGMPPPSWPVLRCPRPVFLPVISPPLGCSRLSYFPVIRSPSDTQGPSFVFEAVDAVLLRTSFFLFIDPNPNSLTTTEAISEEYNTYLGTNALTRNHLVLYSRDSRSAVRTSITFLTSTIRDLLSSDYCTVFGIEQLPSAHFSESRYLKYCTFLFGQAFFILCVSL